MTSGKDKDIVRVQRLEEKASSDQLKHLKHIEILKLANNITSLLNVKKVVLPVLVPILLTIVAVEGMKTLRESIAAQPNTGEILRGQKDLVEALGNANKGVLEAGTGTTNNYYQGDNNDGQFTSDDSNCPSLEDQIQGS